MTHKPGRCPGDPTAERHSAGSPRRAYRISAFLFALAIIAGTRTDSAFGAPAPVVTDVSPTPLVGPNTPGVFFTGGFVISGRNLLGATLTTDGPLQLAGAAVVNAAGTRISQRYSIGCCVPQEGQIFNITVRTADGSTTATDRITLSPTLTNALTGFWSNNGPEGGNVLRVAIDPKTPATIYAGTDTAVAKSTDGGTSWSTVFLGSQIYFLAVDPANPATLYAGGFSGPAFFKSTDAGQTWRSITIAQAGAARVDTLAVDPSASATLYAGTNGAGVFKSTDAGTTWSAVNNGLTSLSVQVLVLDPRTSTTLYAATTAGGAFRSTDAGATWSAINTGLTNLALSDFAIDPSSPATLYAAAFSGVFKSTNAGASWALANTGLAGVSVQQLAVDPLTPATVYAATSGGVFKTTNGGATWSAMNSGLANRSAFTLAIDPVTPATLYTGTFGGGVFKTTDAGTNWNAANAGLVVTTIFALIQDPASPATIYAGAFNGGGVFKSQAGGASWTPLNAGLNRVAALAIHASAPGTIYAGAVDGGGISKSTDAGGTWTAINTGLTDRSVRALAIDPLTPSTLYAGAFTGVFKSINGGSAWSAVSSGLPNTPFLTALAIDPSAPATLYGGTIGSGVFKSTNAGASWNAFNTGLTSLTVFALVIDPTSPSTVYAGTNGGVFKSTDGGANWSATSLKTSTNALVMDPSRTTTLYAGTSFGGVLVSSNAGVNWFPLQSLTNTIVQALAIDRTGTYLHAGTFGGGVFDLSRCLLEGPASPAIAPANNPSGPVTATDSLTLKWSPPPIGPAPTRYEYRINGDPYTSVAGTSAVLNPLGKGDPITLFVRTVGCIPEVPGVETSSPVYSLSPPTANFSFSSGQVNQPINFTDTSSPQATSWLWIFDDEGTSTAQSPAHAFTQSGGHRVALLATNGSGTSLKIQTVFVGGTAVTAITRSLSRFEVSEPGRHRLSNVFLSGPGRIWLQVTSSESEETIVFLRFLDSEGRALLERRLSIGAGEQAVNDPGAYGLEGIFTLELVSAQGFNASLADSAPGRNRKEDCDEQP